MNKKVVLFAVFCLVLAAGTYAATWAYKSSRNTSERAAETFMAELQAGAVDKAYARLSADLKQNREQYWKDYLAQFKTADGEAALQSREAVDNAFNTYAAGSEPQRFVYQLRLRGTDYTLSVVVAQAQSVWVVVGLSGG